MDYFGGFMGGQKRDTGPVSVEAEISIVGHNVDWSVPGNLRATASPGTLIVDGGDVASVEPDPWMGTKDFAVGGTSRGKARQVGLLGREYQEKARTDQGGRHHE